MRVRMKNLQAGPGGVRRPGEVHAVDDAEGEALTAGGFAEALETTAAPAAETAATRAPGPKKRARRGAEAPARATDPRHVGGGWYALADGRKVRGRKAAGLE